MPKLQPSSSITPAQRVTLYDFQRAAVAFIKERDGCAGIFADMRTGKTLIALSYLAKAHAKRILIVCPMSVVGVWRDEIAHIGLPWEVLTLTGSVERSARQLAGMTGRTQCIITNYDAYWRYPQGIHRALNKQTNQVEAIRVKERGLRLAIKRWSPDAIVADEAHRLKSRTTKQARFVHELQSVAGVRLALTGTPIGNGLEDLFSIYRFIDPTIFGTSYAEFERRYITKGGYGGYQIVGYRNQDEVARKLKATAYQVSREDVLRTPTRTSRIVPVILAPKTRKLYEQMKREALIELDTIGPDGNMVHGRALASIVLTNLVRLQQITSGSIPIQVDGQTSFLMTDIGDEKLKVAVELTNDALAANERVVIFCRFRRDLARLLGSFPHHYRQGFTKCAFCSETARQHLSPTKEPFVGVIDGDTPRERRDQRIKALHNGSLKVLLIQIATGALGIDLSAATVAIFYSTGYSLVEFSQARDRIIGHNKSNNVIEYLLQVEHSVDEQILGALMRKQRIARQVTDLNYAKRLFSG